MLRTFAATSLLALAILMPAQQAAAQDPLAGSIFGGAAGAIIGGALGGRGGAVAGAIIGGATGAAIAADGERRANGYYWHRGGCYIQRPEGWIAVSPAYCGGPAYVAPAPRPVYGPPPGAVVVDDDDDVIVAPRRGPVSADAVAACARRYRSYDPNTGTFLSNDGYRKPCP
jgi:hypothetical protein